MTSLDYKLKLPQSGTETKLKNLPKSAHPEGNAETMAEHIIPTPNVVLIFRKKIGSFFFASTAQRC